MDYHSKDIKRLIINPDYGFPKNIVWSNEVYYFYRFALKVAKDFFN